MTPNARPNANVYDIARRLEADIGQRGLTSGARYLTAAEAGKMLGVSTATAHRAMAILSRQEMLVRRRNSGTFVGPYYSPSSRRQIRTLYAILSAAARDRANYPFDLLVHGMGAELRDVNLQIAFLPPVDPLRYLGELIESARSAGETAGFLAISCPREVYRTLADTRLPTVIHGSAYLDQEDIPSVDVDNRQAGRLLTEHLLERGHRRMALLCVTDHLPGDNLFFDGTSDALTAARLAHNALIMRSLPADPETFAMEIRSLLEMDDPPTAFIARTPALAIAARAAVPKPARSRRAMDVVCYAHRPMPESSFPCACALPRVPFSEIVGQIARMLDQLGRGETLEPKHVVIPVDLHVPRRAKGAGGKRRSSK